MELIDEESIKPFISILDAYDQSFYTKNIDDFRSLHVADKRVVFYDNHSNCDSINYTEHERKVENFFNTGEIGKIIRKMSGYSWQVKWHVSQQFFAIPRSPGQEFEQRMFLSLKMVIGKYATCIIRLTQTKLIILHNRGINRWSPAAVLWGTPVMLAL